jgi:SAM-dependent methyltransferase
VRTAVTSLGHRIRTAATFPLLFARSMRATRRASALGGPGIEFARFGRRLGSELLRRGSPLGLDLLITPVNIVRYWEFPFVYACLPDSIGRCLDVSSPRLFSLFVARCGDPREIVMINPDRRDARTTGSMIRRARVERVSVSTRSIEELAGAEGMFDCVWSISVIEHIAGERGDGLALKRMFDALAPGGRLIATVPVDRRFRIEMRDRDAYELQPQADLGESVFFQRYYDETAIRDRLFNEVGVEPSIISWFGETTTGRFQTYEDRWRRVGRSATVDDPLEIAVHYAEFATWADMPGIGVCGFLIQKPGGPG